MDVGLACLASADEPFGAVALAGIAAAVGLAAVYVPRFRGKRLNINKVPMFADEEVVRSALYWVDLDYRMQSPGDAPYVRNPSMEAMSPEERGVYRDWLLENKPESGALLALAEDHRPFLYRAPPSSVAELRPRVAVCCMNIDPPLPEPHNSEIADLAHRIMLRFGLNCSNYFEIIGPDDVAEIAADPVEGVGLNECFDEAVDRCLEWLEQPAPWPRPPPGSSLWPPPALVRTATMGPPASTPRWIEGDCFSVEVPDVARFAPSARDEVGPRRRVRSWRSR